MKRWREDLIVFNMAVLAAWSLWEAWCAHQGIFWWGG